MALREVELGEIALPDFGLPETQPQVGREEYERRVEAARDRAGAAGLDFLIVYGDREHFANMAFLTGYDPRFEEALFVLPVRDEAPLLIVGNEGEGYSRISPLELKKTVYQGFSLLGQPRGESPRLEPILRECGIGEGKRIGLAGWKYAGPDETDEPEHWLEVPAFIVDALRSLVGGRERVVNSTALFMNPVDGLRLQNSADQLAAFEFAAAHCSQAVRNLIEHIRPAVTELEAAANMRLNGLPWSAHLMFSTGERSALGLPSPGTRRIAKGDPFFAAFGLQGGLTARAGFVASSESDLREKNRGYVEHMVKPYFRAAAAWYEAVGIGFTGGEVCRAVQDALKGLELTLNPGHYIHLDEWVHTPFYPASDIALRSGMLIQCDMIPHAHPKYHTANIEDTIALADEALRNELARKYPGLWKRVEARREFMTEQLGIELNAEVLAFSNMAAAFQPFALSPSLAMRVSVGRV